MNVVGLISGGKDSLLNLTKCVEAGHKIICLANMCPEQKAPSTGSKEIDSYCFQSVAQEHVPMIAKCMGLPLHCGKLTESTSINQSLWYETTEGDEVENLFDLLQEIKQLYWDQHRININAISTGAIESNFQRIRVVHLCERLGLTHLAFLWKKPPKDILEDVITNRVRAIIVKVSSMGLSPEDYLGKVIDDQLVKKLLQVPYIHAAGEGGEFETFTLNSPLFIHGFIEVMSPSIHILQKSDVVTTAILNFIPRFIKKTADLV